MRACAWFYAFFAGALLTGAGCDQATTFALPTAPGAPAVSAPAVSSQGQITVLSIQPESGATLTAEPCDGGYCVEGVRLTFAVQLDQEVTDPWVTVSLYNGLQRCAGSGYPNVFQTLEPLRANTATTFTVSGLGVSDQTGLLCPLPQTTTRMVVQLWPQRGRSGAALLTREFAQNYTFVQ